MEHQLIIAVCDSNGGDRVQTCRMTKQILDISGIASGILEFENAQDLLAAVNGGIRFDMLLTDTLLEGMSGLELAAALRKLRIKAQIVFISANRELALQGYEVSAARYLAKPLSEDKLGEALLHCYGIISHGREILLPTDQGNYFTRLEEIVYVEAYDRGTNYYLTGDSVVCSRMKFREAEEQLCASGFMVCHRSYIVNLSRIRYIRRYELVLKDGRSVPIGKARYSEIIRRITNGNE